MAKSADYNQIEVLSKIQDIRNRVLQWKKEGFIVGFVPTMGALHIGHESLIKKAKEECDKVVVSIFVNPTQFGPNEDFNHYPRQLENDRGICLRNGASLIFAPAIEEMYPEWSSSSGYENLTKICPPEILQNKMCGNTRKGHFDGVALVVLKLFNIIQPDKAYFGQKDAQQLIVIRKLCKDIDLPLEVVSCPIVRDPDGLACSSRNTYLSASSRKKALSLYQTLKKVDELYNSGIKSANEVLSTARKCLDSDIELEYFEIRDIDKLELLSELKSGCLIAIAARVDGIRLIDNIIIR